MQAVIKMMGLIKIEKLKDITELKKLGYEIKGRVVNKVPCLFIYLLKNV